MEKNLKDLVLNLKTEYYDDIFSGEKKFEYRLIGDYWKKRLTADGQIKQFRRIVIRKGYPKKGDPHRELIRPWVGIEVKSIIHPHFGAETVKVYAIIVN
jgi:hypothetical protein